MKYKILCSIVIFILCINTSIAQDEYFDFEAKNIQIEDNGNLIRAIKGKIISKREDYEITANEFQYFKKKKILRINGNASIVFKSNELEIKFNSGLIDQNKLILETYGKIDLTYQDQKYKINSKKIIFDYSKFELSSNSKSIFIFENSSKNNLITESFKYEIKSEILKVKELKFTDKLSNSLYSSLAQVNMKNNQIFGKDIDLEFNNKSLNLNNEPRLKGNAIKETESLSEISKGVFTTCKKNNNCPAWELSAKKIQHDKKKKIINYKDAVLKIYDLPVLFLPFFSHPDPSVEKKSGFLMPSIKNSNNEKSFLNLPYYFLISDNKDATFSPRFYNDNEFLLQTELRQKNFKSNHISDFSFKINDNKKLQSHFFYKYDRSFNLDNFIENKLFVNVQKVSKDTYLKKNKINSDIIKNTAVLENSVKLNLFNEKTSMDIETYVYEDLNKDDTDKYEFIIPKIDISTKLNNKTVLNGDFYYNFQALTKKYNTNIFEISNINDLLFKSSPIITNKGFYNNFEFLIKNSNSDANNSIALKNHENVYLSGLIQYNSTLPMIKEDMNYKKTLIPKFSFKMAPKFTKDNRKDDYKIDNSNVYSLYRNVRSDSIEGGFSFIYGSDFSIFDKNNSSEKFNFKISNNLRLRENDDLPRNSQIDEQISSFFNEISYQPNKFIKMNYNSSVKNNFSDINYESFKTEFKLNNLVTEFNYFNQNDITNDSYLKNITTFKLDESNQLTYSTQKNKTTNLTEYYNLAYQYKNDCLSASIQYNKDYYADKDIRPNESVTFKLTILPFN
jgi:LPS-assembly protein